MWTIVYRDSVDQNVCFDVYWVPFGHRALQLGCRLIALPCTGVRNHKMVASAVSNRSDSRSPYPLRISSTVRREAARFNRATELQNLGRLLDQSHRRRLK